MFKNLTIYRIGAGWTPELTAMEEALDAAKFVPCTATQEKSVGWAPPRGEEHGALVESVAGQLILKLVIETKSVPSASVKAKAQEAADHIEATTGRKPGKKETKELREDALRSGDVQHRTATIKAEQRTWTRWWLPFKRVSRSIDVEFNAEVGERTGSWKGGCLGCGYEMKPGETPLQALRRMEKERAF